MNVHTCNAVIGNYGPRSSYPQWRYLLLIKFTNLYGFTFTILWANLADDNLIIVFSFFSQTIGFDISMPVT